jgi:hypothetical protein
MKIRKTLRTIALLVCMLVITAAPMNAYASTLPVCVTNLPSVKAFEYRPDPLIVQPGTKQPLFDFTNNISSSFAVPAYATPAFAVNTPELVPYLFEVYMTSPSYTLVNSTVSSGGGAWLEVDKCAYDRNFIIYVTPIGGKPIRVNSYTYSYNVW